MAEYPELTDGFKRDIQTLQAEMNRRNAPGAMYRMVSRTYNDFNEIREGTIVIGDLQGDNLPPATAIEVFDFDEKVDGVDAMRVWIAYSNSSNRIAVIGLGIGTAENAKEANAPEMAEIELRLRSLCNSANLRIVKS